MTAEADREVSRPGDNTPARIDTDTDDVDCIH